MIGNKTQYVIYVKLKDGINYYCGLVKWNGESLTDVEMNLILQGNLNIPLFESWDTDIKYCVVFNTKFEAKKHASRLYKVTRKKIFIKPYEKSVINFGKN